MAEENKKIVGFKKFTDIKGKSKIEEVNPSLDAKPMTDSDLPANPNISKDSKKIEKPISRKNLIPQDQDINLPSDEDKFENDINLKGKKNEGNVETFGKVAKFPKNTKASKAYNFLENVKEGVDLSKFVNQLKGYYTKKYSKDAKFVEMINKIKVDGNDKYSMVQNIPLVEVEGKKMITRITEDLIKLLSK